VASAVAAALLIGAIGVWWVARSGNEGSPAAIEQAPAVAEPVHVVGVAPFANRTGNPDFDWYGEGIAQLVTDSLSQSRLLQVIADPVDPATGQPRQELGLTALVSGDIVPSPSGVAVAARIVEIAGGRNLAAERVDDLDPENLLGCADEISAAARQGLGLPPEDTVDVYSADFAVGNPEAYRAYVQGLRAFADWRYEDAEREISQALALAPDFTMARYRLAWIFAATSRVDEAAAEMDRAAASAAGLTDREARYVRAGQAEFESRLDDALAEYEQLVELYPYDTEARHLLAGVLHDLARYDEEIGELETLARLDPANSVVQSMLGYAHLERGDATRAVIALQRYVEMEPGSANGHHILGDAYRAQNELDLAAEEYRRSLAADPAFHFAITGLASVEVMQGDLRAAESRLRALVDESDASPRARIDGVFDLASVLRAQGKFAAAADALESLVSAIEAEQVREAMALAIRGLCLLELNRTREAKRLVDRSIERSPGVATRYLFTRGLLELREENLAAVNSTAAEILEGALPPDDPDRTEDKAAAYLQGMESLRRGEVDQAVDRLLLAVTLEGHAYAVYRLGLAEAFLAAGRLPEALAASRQAHESRDPSDPRLDLELDRTRALLTLADVQRAMDRPDKAAARAQEFLARWRDADAGLADLGRAQKLAGDR
jgi:tetratricopeptide (TPR) repeat protein